MPADEPTESMINTLAETLSPDDIILDGGNSNYRDSVRRAEVLKTKGFRFLDVGTNGGIWGLEEDYSLMVGGDETAFRHLEPIFRPWRRQRIKGMVTSARLAAAISSRWCITLSNTV